MRELLDNECAVVAGGHASECEKKATKAAIITGAVIGAIAGASAGGMGVLPGAVAGAGTGSLVAQIVAPALCKWAKEKKGGYMDFIGDGIKGDESGSVMAISRHQLIVIPPEDVPPLAPY